MLTSIWHMLSSGELYNGAGGDYFQRRDPSRQIKRLVAQVERLGQHVPLEAGTA
jgi:hypothetical protein